jgi:hypothetical protein
MNTTPSISGTTSITQTVAAAINPAPSNGPRAPSIHPEECERQHHDDRFAEIWFEGLESGGTTGR